MVTRPALYRPSATNGTLAGPGDGDKDAIGFPPPPHTDVPSVQPVLDSQAWHSFEIGSVGGATVKNDRAGEMAVVGGSFDSAAGIRGAGRMRKS
jgi:hypothetical protein